MEKKMKKREGSKGLNNAARRKTKITGTFGAEPVGKK